MVVLHNFREADAIFIEELRAAGWYDKVSQVIICVLPVVITLENGLQGSWCR
jgi:GMP synthase PP-ATPase subunit